MRNTPPVSVIVDQFVNQLGEAIEAAATERARDAILSAIGAEPTPERRKLPRQLCPVTGCKNTAAPIFGMVCKVHRGLPKGKVKKFRALRRAEREAAAG